MLITASYPNTYTVKNLVAHLLKKGRPNLHVTKSLLELIPDNQSTLSTRLHIANELLALSETVLAENTLSDVTPIRYFEKKISPEWARTIFKTFVLIDRAEEIIDLLNNEKLLCHFNKRTIVDLKLTLSLDSIRMGKCHVARSIVEEFNAEKLITKNQSGLLILAYIQLSMFTKALEVFNLSKQKRQICENMPSYLAALYVSLGQIDKAQKNFDTLFKLTSKSPLNTLWKAKLLNYTGNYDSALYWLDSLIEDSSIDLTRRCSALVEKGNTFRAKGMPSESLVYFKKARKLDADIFWLHIAHFELAMTLLHLEKFDEAYLIAERGHVDLKRHNYGIINPCTILSSLMDFCIYKAGSKFSIPLKLVTTADLWPYPFTPHGILMIIFIAIICWEQGNVKKARRVYRNLMTSFQIAQNDFNERNVTNHHSEELIDSGFVAQLGESYFPNDPNWTVVLQIIKRYLN